MRTFLLIALASLAACEAPTFGVSTTYTHALAPVETAHLDCHVVNWADIEQVVQVSVAYKAGYGPMWSAPENQAPESTHLDPLETKTVGVPPLKNVPLHETECRVEWLAAFELVSLTTD